MHFCTIIIIIIIITQGCTKYQCQEINTVLRLGSKEICFNGFDDMFLICILQTCTKRGKLNDSSKQPF